MAAVVDGTQVVVLLDFACLTIELSHNDTVVRNGVGHAAGLGHQLLVLIERADVHPVLVALGRQLIL